MAIHYITHRMITDTTLAITTDLKQWPLLP